MATVFRGTPAAQINQSMKILLPETNGCNYGDFPMTGGAWLKGSDKAPDDESGGEYCFIKTECQMPGFKVGYVWGAGPMGYGYYHLLTRAAHVILYHRIHSRRVFTGGPPEPEAEVVADCGCFGKRSTSSPKTVTPRSTVSTHLPKIPVRDLDTLRQLFHARSISAQANDAVAKQQQLLNADKTVQAFYGADQNFQLVSNTTKVANLVAAAG